MTLPAIRCRSYLLYVYAIVSALTSDAADVQVPDPRLEALIRAQIVEYGEPLTDADLAKVQELSSSLYGGIAEEDQVRSLEGLQHAVNLRQLTLRGHDVNDLSPISELEALEILDLSSNANLDATGLEQMDSLRSLNLFYCNLGTATFLSSLTNLEYLVLQGNQLSELPSISHLDKLQTLDLSTNQISDISFIHDFPDLEVLDVGHNNIGSISTLAGFPKLERLRIGGNPLSDASSIASFPSLKRLEANFIKDPLLMNHLAGLRELVSLTLYQCDIYDLSPLSGLLKLEELKLDGNRVLDLSPLENLVVLRNLNLPLNHARDITALENLPALEEANLWGNYIDLSAGSPSQLAYAYLTEERGVAIDVRNQLEILIQASLSSTAYGVNGGEGILSIESNTYWAASTDADWLQATPLSGFQDSQIALSVLRNPTGSERAATLEVGGQELSVEQEYDQPYFTYLSQLGFDPEDPKYWTTWDADNDGISNHFEYLADTGLADSASRLFLAVSRSPQSSSRLQLVVSKAPIGEEYTVEQSEDLLDWSEIESTVESEDESFRYFPFELTSFSKRSLFFRINLGIRK